MSVTGHHSFREVDTHTNPAGTTVDTATLDWSATISGSLQDIQNGTAVPKLTMMSGTVSQQGSGSASALSCSGALSAAPGLSPGAIGDYLNIYPPGDTSVVASNGVQPATNADSKNFLVVGTIPGIAHPQDIVSSDTNPSEAGCNTGGITFDYAPPAGSAQYSSWTKVLDAFAYFTGDGQSVGPTSASFDYSGPIEAPPGYSSTVTEQDSIAFSFGGCQLTSGSAANTALVQPAANGQARLVSALLDQTGGGGCVSIVWLNPPVTPDPPIQINGKTENVLPGQSVQLAAQINGLNAKSSDSITWTIPGPTASTYTESARTAAGAADSTGQVVGLSPDALSQPTVKFFWISGGSQTVDLTVNNLKAHATFTIHTPQWQMAPPDTCPPGLITDSTIGRTLALPAFGLGSNDGCPKKAGIGFHPSLDLNDKAGSTGAHIAVTQLAQYQFTHNGNECGAQAGFALDNHDFYLQQVQPIRVDDVDSPAYSVAGQSGTYFAFFVARDYVMYLPPGGDSYWVPLARFGWQWSLTVTKPLIGGWQAKDPSVSATNATSWDQEPTWTSLASNVDIKQC